MAPTEGVVITGFVDNMIRPYLGGGKNENLRDEQRELTRALALRSAGRLSCTEEFQVDWRASGIGTGQRGRVPTFGCPWLTVPAIVLSPFEPATAAL